MKRFRVYDGFTDCHSKKAKIEHGLNQVKKYGDMLAAGWSPFVDGKNVYEDNIHGAAKLFKVIRAGNHNFNYCTNQYLPEISGLAKRSYENYLSRFRVLGRWLDGENMGANDIKYVDNEVMKGFFLWLINGQKLSKTSVNIYRYMLGKFFDWAVKNKYMRITPMRDLPVTTRLNDTAARPIHEADIEKLSEAIRKDDPQLWLAVQLEYYCFLRPGLEIRFSRVGWFDLARGVVNVPKEFIKTRDNKTVIIPNQLREYLMTDCKIQQYPGNYFLIGRDGVPGVEAVGINNLRRRFCVIRDRLELPKEYKLYSFKHTGNSRLVDGVVPMYHIQKQNGHSSMRSTEEYIKNKIGFKSVEILNNFPTL